MEAAHEQVAESTILDEMNSATRALAELVEPSVVHVSTRSVLRDKNNRPVTMGSSGSGWVWDERGYIVTNAHVVDGADEIEVQLYNGTLRKASVVGLDLRTDIAVVRIDEERLHPAIRSEGDPLKQGEMVFAFGSPFDFRFSMSAGIVSGLGRSAGLTDIDYENFIQVDAAINPGNSGGPLTDIRGRVVGMNTAIATGRGGSLGVQGQFAGIGLAIPMSTIESAVPQLIEHGEVEKGFIGVSLLPVSEMMARSLGFDGYGVLVRGVVANGPAARAGLRPLDIITEVDGQKVLDDGHFRALVATRRPGETVNLAIWRGESDTGSGVPVDFEVVLDKLDPALVAPSAKRAFERLGVAEMVTASRPRDLEYRMRPERGVLVVRVTPDTPAARTLPPGSLITAVNDQPVGSLDDLYSRLSRLVGLFRIPGIPPRLVTLDVIPPGGGALQKVPLPVE